MKDPTTTIRKYVNQLKVHEKIVSITIKQNLSPDINPLDCAIWGILENKTNATSYQNIGLIKTTIKEEWNKMSEESILKSYKLFRSRFDTVIEKKMVAMLNKFTFSCLSSYFIACFLKNQN